MDKRAARMGWGLLAGLLFGGASATGVLLAKELERRFAPVVSDAVITQSKLLDDGLLIWGTFDKSRDCRFVEAVAQVGAVSLDLEYLDASKNKATSRPTGPQTFGPWRLSPGLYPVTITVRHACHSLWTTTTTLIKDYKP
jgi:hypothetical protein